METTKDVFLCHSSSFRFSTSTKHRFFIYFSAVVVTTYNQVSETHKAGSSSFRNTQVSVTTYKLIQDTGSSNTQVTKMTGSQLFFIFLGTNFFGVVLFFLGVP